LVDGVTVFTPKRLWDSIWEQLTHWLSALVLKISGASCSVVNLEKMITVEKASLFDRTIKMINY
jgi:hypothetical protein